jgi:branched-chain amino acid transport system substrate-binding protein
MLRKKLELLSIGLFSFLLLTALLGTATPTLAADTIKIAFMDPLSGPVALVGQSVHQIFRFCVDQTNKKGGLLGRQIEGIYVDTEFKPQVAVRKAKELILDKKVDFIVIGSSSNIGEALMPVSAEYKKILVNLGALSNIIHSSKFFSRYAFRPQFNTWAQGAAYGAYYGGQPYNNFYLLNPDYAFGHDFSEAVIDNLKKKKPSAKILADEYYQVGVKDWAPFLSKIKTSGAEVVVTCAFGTDALTLLKQAHQFDLKVSIGDYTLTVPSVLTGAGETALGVVTVGGILNTDPNPNVQRMDQMVHEMNKNDPNTDTHWAYGVTLDYINGWNFFMAAVEKAKSLDPEKIIKTWEGMEYTSLNGDKVIMRACDHQMLLPMSVAKVVPGKNKYLGDVPYISAPVAKIPIKETSIPATAEYNSRCK